MTTETEDMPKIRRTVTISKDLYDWLQTQIKQKTFKDVSHAIDYSLYHVKEEMEKSQKT
jgi:Arc/MetJ-type ribon-helix-helix transcriptional regulator